MRTHASRDIVYIMIIRVNYVCIFVSSQFLLIKDIDVNSSKFRSFN